MTATTQVQRLPEEGEISIATAREISDQELGVRGIMELSSKKSDGVEIIKSILAGVESSKGDAITAVTYVGAPRYRKVVSAENFKVAEKAINNAVERIRTSIEKQNGAFNFAREESKIAHRSGQAA